MPDSAQIASIMSMGQRMLSPAQLVLDHRAELALSPDQVKRLEALALAQRDSVRLRIMRSQEKLTDKANGASMGSSMAWTGPVNEPEIREAARRQADSQAETMIGLARDRRAVGAELTPQQLALLPRVEGAELMRSVRPPQGIGASAAPHDPSVPYFEFQVEKQVTQVPNGVAAKYPEVLKSARVEGQVLAQFVVDSAGHAEMSSFKVLKSQHELFTQAVRDALPQMLFTPAELGGKKVRQIVQQPFVFSVSP